MLRALNPDPGFMHGGPGLDESAHSLRHGAGYVRFDGIDVEVWAVRDTPTLDRAGDGLAEGRRIHQGEGITGVWAGHDLKAHGRILNGPSQGALKEERGEAPERLRPPGEGNSPVRRLVAVHVAPRGWDPDRTARVGSFADGHETVSHRGGASS